MEKPDTGKESRFCTRCGKTISAGALFCKYCGKEQHSPPDMPGFETMPEQGDDYSSPPVQGGDRKKRFPLLVCLVVFILLGFLGIASIFAVITLIKKEGRLLQVSRGFEGFTFVPAGSYTASSGTEDEEKHEPYGKSSEIDRRELEPSAASQTYSLQPVMNVIIPGGLLEASTPLVINAIAELSHVPSFYKEEMAYDISLGDLHELPMPVMIEFIIPSDLDLQDLVVAHWERERALWMEMPFTVREGRFLQVAASRLSPFAVFSGGKKLADAARLLAGSPTPSPGASPVPHGAEIYKTTHFAINFNHNEITSPFSLAELQKYDNRARQEYDTFKQSHDARTSLVHLFIKRMGCDLESAYAAYKTGGFKMPAAHVCVNVYKPASFNENPRWRTLMNDIQIPSNLSSIQQMRIETAHELFHMVQDQYYVMSAAHVAGRAWWIEATAEYAAGAIAWPAYGPPGKSIKFNYTERPVTYFSERLTDPYNAHQYHTAYLLDYLVKRDGSTFKKLWDHVITASNEVSALRSYGWKTPLPDVYRSFAAFLILSGSSPARKAVKDRFNYIIPLSVITQNTTPSRPVSGRLKPWPRRHRVGFGGPLSSLSAAGLLSRRVFLLLSTK